MIGFGLIYLLEFESPLSMDASAHEVGTSVLLSVRSLTHDFHMHLQFSTLQRFSQLCFYDMVFFGWSEGRQ